MEIIKLLKYENELLEALLMISKEGPIQWSLNNKISFLNTKKNFVDRITQLRKQIKEESKKKINNKLNSKEKLVLNYLMKQRKYLVCSIIKENKGLLNHLNEQMQTEKKVA